MSEGVEQRGKKFTVHGSSKMVVILTRSIYRCGDDIYEMNTQSRPALSVKVINGSVKLYMPRYSV